MSVTDRLRTETLVLDGGFATELEARGHDLSGRLWSARLLRERPDAVVAAHRAFIEAGADVIITASYQASHAGYVAAGLSEQECDADLDASVALARTAVAGLDIRGRGPGGDGDHPDEADDRTGAVLVAASVGPYGAHLADGSEYTGYPGVSRIRLRDFHARRLERLVAAAPDLVAVETLPEVLEAEVVVELLEELAPALPYWVSYSATGGGRLTGGAPFAEAVAVVRGAGVAVGVNCTHPAHVPELLASASPELPYVVYPNSGATYDAERQEWDESGSPRFPDGTVRGWRSQGARLVGGCCGVSPAGVRGLATALRS